jgi:hypothetical protein
MWSVWFSDTVMITVLNSVTRKRLLKTKKTLCVYVLGVRFSETVVVACGGDP